MARTTGRASTTNTFDENDRNNSNNDKAGKRAPFMVGNEMQTYQLVVLLGLVVFNYLRSNVYEKSNERVRVVALLFSSSDFLQLKPYARSTIVLYSV
jgi:hypothetical protein